MLSATEVLIVFGFVIALGVLATIDIALLNANKVSVRRLVDGPRGKTASGLALLLDNRMEVVTSIHIVIQLLMVTGAVLLVGALQRLAIPYSAAVFSAVVLTMFVVIVFRHLLPRIITHRNPEAILIYLFPLLQAVHLTLDPVSRLLVSGMNYFHRAEEGTEPEKEE